MLSALKIHEVLIEFVTQELLSGRTGADMKVDDDLLGSELIDSLGIMLLINFIEQRYDLKVPPEDVTIDHFMTVGAISSYLRKRLQA